ncbi:MAG: YfhO family protein [Candidatus Bruticola sp.]
MYAKFKPYLVECLCAFLLASLASSLLFAPIWFTSSFIYAGDYTGSDLLDMNLPLRFLAAQSVKRGSMPLWSPEIGCGFPLLAEGQAGVFYPSTLPLFMLFSVPWASNLSIISSLAIAFFGGYILGRVHGLSRQASCITALTAAFSPILVFRIKHLNMLQAAVWSPLAFSAVKLICTYASKQREDLLIPLRSGDHISAQLVYRSGILLLSLCWLMQILAGHPHIACVCGLAALIYAIILWLKNTIEKKQLLYQSFFDIAKALFISALAAVAVSGLQLLPTAELAAQSSRGHAYSWDSLKMFPFTWEHFKLFLNPFWLGNPAQATTEAQLQRNIISYGVFWESMPYIGLVPLFFMFYSLRRLQHFLLGEAAVAALVFLLMALGPQGWLYWLPWKLCPGFNLFRFPARFLIPFGTVAALWVGCGFDAFKNDWFNKWQSKLETTVFALIALTVWFNFFWAANEYVSYLPNSIFRRPITADMCEGASRIASPTMQNNWASIVQLQGWKNSSDAIVSIFHALSPDSAIFWGLKQNTNRTVFEGGMCLVNYTDIQKAAIKFINLGAQNKQHFMRISRKGLQLYKLQNVSHLLSFETLIDTPSKPGNLVGETELPPFSAPLHIYKLNEPQPRVILASAFTEGEANLSVDSFLNEYGASIEETSFVVIHKGDNKAVKTDSYQSSSSRDRSDYPLQPNEYCRITQDTPLHLELEVNTNQTRALLFTENYYPSWRAFLNGSPLKIYRANLAFMGCIIPPGHHKIVLNFVSVSLKWGSLLSLMGIILILRLIFLTWQTAKEQISAR